MKQVTYEIRGLVIETMIPSIKASCESIADVRNVRVTAVDTDTARLTLVVDGDPTQELEASVRSVMDAKGLELVTPPQVEAYAFAPVPPVTPAPRPATPPPPPDTGKKISLTAALSTVIVSVVLAVLLTFSLTTAYMKGNTASAVSPGQSQSEASPFDQIEILDRLFRSATVLDLDEEELIAGVLKGYVAATGDIYAEYFTAEEYQAQIDSNNGKMCGIGVNIVSETLNMNGERFEVITIVNVYPDSPAEKAGVRPGDHIMYVGTGEGKVSVDELGYETALTRLAGEVGTECAFTVLRPSVDSSSADPYETVEITAIREFFTTRSVTFRHYTEDETVGIIKMTGFDNTTRDQFIEAVETLKSEGCTSFVLDLRGNPGGMLSSVEDVLVPLEELLAHRRQPWLTVTVHPVVGDNAAMLRALSDYAYGHGHPIQIALENERRLPDKTEGDSLSLVLAAVTEALDSTLTCTVAELTPSPSMVVRTSRAGSLRMAVSC